MIEQYRFETGTLFEFDDNNNAYFAVYTNAHDDTKSEAIKAYEALSF